MAGIFTPRDATGAISFPKLTPSSYAQRITTSSAGSNRYQAFARVIKNTGQTQCCATMLVTGYGSISDATFGAALVSYYARSNALGLKVAALAAPNTAATFGYWDGGDGYWYIGVYRGSHYSPLSVMLLTDAGGGNYAVDLGDFYQSATQPTGWTEVGSGINVVYCPPSTALASIAELQTFLTTQRTAQGSTSVGFYLVRFTTAASPFVAGARVNVQLNVAEGANGVATLTTYGTSNPEMYLMRLYNGTWGLPKKVTVAT